MRSYDQFVAIAGRYLPDVPRHIAVKSLREAARTHWTAPDRDLAEAARGLLPDDRREPGRRSRGFA